jgi:hypothetical protein
VGLRRQQEEDVPEDCHGVTLGKTSSAVICITEGENVFFFTDRGGSGSG